MQTKIQALRELRQIVRNHDDLITFENGEWTFNEIEAHEYADDEPHNDARQVEDATPGQSSQLPEAIEMNHEHEHHQHPHAHTPHGHTFHHGSTADAHADAVEVTQTYSTETHPINHEHVSVTSEAVSLEGLEIQHDQHSAEAAETAPAPAKAPKPESEKQRERRLLKESNKAKREAATAERKRLADEKATKKAEKKAQREADNAAKEQRKTERKTKADAKAADKAKSTADREARIAERKASAVNGVYKPVAGSTLAGLWEVIDSLSDVFGRLPTFAEYAEGVRGKYGTDAAAGTPLTQTTAYYNYRRFHGIKVRKNIPEAPAVTA